MKELQAGTNILGNWLVGWLVVWLAGWLVGWLFGWLVGWLVGWFDGWLTINLKITLTSKLIRRNWAYISHPEVRKRMRVENGEQSGAVRSHLYEKYVYIFKVFSTLDQIKIKILIYLLYDFV